MFLAGRTSTPKSQLSYRARHLEFIQKDTSLNLFFINFCIICNDSQEVDILENIFFVLQRI